MLRPRLQGTGCRHEGQGNWPVSVDMDAALIDSVALDRELSSRGLMEFMRVVWPQIDQSEPVFSWHNEAMCEALEAVSAGEIRDLIIAIPPGFSKTSTVCVAWPVWEWATVNAGLKYLMAGYSERLILRDSGKVKTLMESQWYIDRWPDVTLKSAAVSHLENTQKGIRFATSVGGSATGMHGDRIIVDDPMKAADAIGSRAALGTALQTVRDWWDTTMSTRQTNPKTTARVIVAQRLHEDDLSGHILRETEGVHHLCLPMEYDPKTTCYVEWDRRLPDGTTERAVIEDPREEEDELLCPERYPRKVVERLKKRLRPSGVASQFQQRPTPAGGGTLKKEWFRYWGAPGCKYVSLPERRREIQVWDLSFKGKPTGGKKRSYVCGQAWAQVGADMLLMGQERGQWGFVEQQAALRRMTNAYPNAHAKYIEEAANGAAIMDAMRDKIPGLKGISAGGGSEARAEVASVYLESGNVFFPHPSIAPWVADLEAELIAFPMGRNDDQVDCVTHGTVQMVEFARSSASKVVTEAAIAAAGARPVGDSNAMARAGKRLTCGLEVARGHRDESALVMRRGTSIVRIATVQDCEPNSVASWAVDEVLRMAHPVDTYRLIGPPTITVECSGHGAETFDALSRGNHPIDIIDHYGASESDNEDLHANARTQAWFAIGQWLSDVGAMAFDPAMSDELTGTTYKFRPGGEMVLESREEARKRCGASPCRGDALALALIERERKRGVFRVKGL